jgi:protein-glucosylgalactosylhydroxylysine glucosidase
MARKLVNGNGSGGQKNAASKPISPPPARGAGGEDLPAYLSNGMIGLRVRANPCMTGMMLLSGFAGEDPIRHILVGAAAPYPLAIDLALDGVWMSDVPGQVDLVEQSYDFATAELSSRLSFAAGGARATIEILTFCSRDQPSILCQEMVLVVDNATDVKIRPFIDGRGVSGRPALALRGYPGEPPQVSEGALLWESPGRLSTCGLAYSTELIGAKAEPSRPGLQDHCLSSEYAFRARASRSYRLRQIVSVVASVTHHQPECQADRLLGKALQQGFVRLREGNQKCWADLWRGRIRIRGADKRWQELTDAAFYYLNSSAHASSPASTSMFGLATWHDYHYYYGHVMWDIESFVVPAVTFLQPHAAAALLDFRTRTIMGARHNAQLMGRRGLQFPWESDPSTGEEAAPLPGSASWHEDHVSLDVAEAFAFFANVTGDERFLHDKAWPILAGVCDWIASRVVETGRGYEFPAAMGVAERKAPSDNSAFTNMAAIRVLRHTIAAGKHLGRPIDPAWQRIADELVIPRRGDVVLSHDGYRASEEKGATPDPLMGIFPLGFELGETVERATIAYYLSKADDYIGAPMLSALYGVWAARLGDRERALQYLEEGYGRFDNGRFHQTLEYRRDKFPDQPPAGPFFANIGGYLASLILGFAGLRPSSADISQWTTRPIVLPEGWDAIEIDRLWVRGHEARLEAVHGADRAVLEFRD